MSSLHLRVLARHLTMNAAFPFTVTRPVSEVHRVGSSDIRRSRCFGTFSHIKSEKGGGEEGQETRSHREWRVGKATNAGQGGMDSPFTANLEARPSHTLSLTHPLRFSQGTCHVARFIGNVLWWRWSSWTFRFFSSSAIKGKRRDRNTASKQQENRSQKKGQAGCRCEKLKVGNKLNILGHLPLLQWPIGRGTRCIKLSSTSTCAQPSKGLHCGVHRKVRMATLSQVNLLDLVDGCPGPHHQEDGLA